MRRFYIDLPMGETFDDVSINKICTDISGSDIEKTWLTLPAKTLELHCVYENGDQKTFTKEEIIELGVELMKDLKSRVEQWKE